VDIMGVQRGAHKDGAHICAHFVFKKPGGKNPDGTTLWGWNDVEAANCAACGCRDMDHVVLRDLTDEYLKKDREREAHRARKSDGTPPGATSYQPGRREMVRAEAGEADPTAANPTESAPSLTYISPIQVYELEPGIPDPLALNAYHETQKAMQEAAAAQAAQTATGSIDSDAFASAAEENARFKAEVERAVKEQMAMEHRAASAASAPAHKPAAPRSVKEMLASVGLDRHLAAFEEEGMELDVLVQLANADGGGKEALDEALKEVGVKSVGHRLKIFAALQG